MNVTFEESAWELAARKLRKGDRISAVRFLTLLEGETEEELEDALALLDELSVTLDIGELPEDFGSGEAENRLRMEHKLARQGLNPEQLPEDDTLRLYLQEMAAIPVCGDARLLALELAEGKRTETVQSALVNLSLSRVVELACGYTGRGVLLTDLIQEGSLGLWQGVLAYTGEREFEEDRDWWIRQYMARVVTMQARQKGVGQKMREGMDAYRTADRKLLTVLGRNPTAEEIAQEMGVSPEQAYFYEDMLRSARQLEKAKPAKAQPEQEEDDQSVENTALFQSRQRIADMLSNLTAEEAKLLTLRFGLEGGMPASTQEAAQALGITADEVVAREAAALAKLRGTV